MKMKGSSFRKLQIAPAVVLSFFLMLACGYWFLGTDLFMALNFLYIGIFTTVGMLLYAVLPQRKKFWGRRISFFMVGLSIFLGMGVFGRMDAQLEGFFFYSLAGVTAGVGTHYLVAKILGPVFLQRSWCGWGCWTMMVLDLLPFKRSKGRLEERWGWLRYLHFAFSLGLVLLLWYGVDYSISRNKWDIAGMYWFLAGNGVYYALGIGLAFLLKDNRAFCKYVCPVTVFLKASSAFSVLRIKGERELCNECNACTKMCPMDIRIPEYILNGKRVVSTECILCLTCVDVCVPGALRASVGFDLGEKQSLLTGKP